MKTAATLALFAICLLAPFGVWASDQHRCAGACLVRVQYDYNSMTPDQQYQEKQREYREQQNDEYYQRERQQRELQQDLDRRGGGGGGRSYSYGAIAYSSDKGDYGYSERYGSRAQAEREAMKQCGKDDCEVAVWFYNSCGALAVDDDGNWGGGDGDDAGRAQRDAVASCAEEGGKTCKVIFTHCSR